MKVSEGHSLLVSHRARSVSESKPAKSSGTVKSSGILHVLLVAWVSSWGACQAPTPPQEEMGTPAPAAVPAEAADAAAVAAVAAPAPRPEELDELRRVFEAYRDATLRRDGEAAARLISDKTLERYEKMRVLAVEGSRCVDGQGKDCEQVRERMRKAGLGERLMIALMLMRLGEQRLERLSARQLFVTAVNQGWVGRESIINSGMGELQVDAHGIASAPVLAEDLEAPLEWRFFKQSDGWKMDLGALMHYADSKLKQQALGKGLSEDAALEQLLENLGEQKMIDPWLRFFDEEGGFTVMMPEPPERSVIDGVVFFRARSVESRVFIVGYSDVEADSGSLTEVYDNATRGLLMGAKGKLVEALDGTEGGRAQREVVVDHAGGQRSTARFVLVGQRLFQLIVLAQSDADAGPANAFFASFTIQ